MPGPSCFSDVMKYQPSGPAYTSSYTFERKYRMVSASKKCDPESDTARRRLTIANRSPYSGIVISRSVLICTFINDSFRTEPIPRDVAHPVRSMRRYQTV